MLILFLNNHHYYGAYVSMEQCKTFQTMGPHWILPPSFPIPHWARTFHAYGYVLHIPLKEEVQEVPRWYYGEWPGEVVTARSLHWKTNYISPCKLQWYFSPSESSLQQSFTQWLQHPPMILDWINYSTGLQRSDFLIPSFSPPSLAGIFLQRRTISYKLGINYHFSLKSRANA